MVHNMAQVQRNAEMVDKMALLLAAITFVKALVPYGRPIAEMLFKKRFSGQGVSIDEVFDKVEWPVKLDETSGSTIAEGRFSTRCALGFEDVVLTPQQQKQQQQQQTQREQQQKQQQQPQSQSCVAFVATQVHNWESGQPPRPIRYDSETNNTTEQTALTAQALHEDAVARVHLGKGHTLNQQTQEPPDKREPRTDDSLQRQDLWTIDKQGLEGKLNIALAMINQLQERVVKTEQQQKTEGITTTTQNTMTTPATRGTPMVNNIATPPIRGTTQNLIDFESIRKGVLVNRNGNVNGRIIHNGILYNDIQSLSDGGTPYMAKETSDMYQLGNNGFPGGGGGDPTDDEDGRDSGNANNRGVYYREFTLVCPNKVIILTFSKQT